jgi:hypothetical protein
VPRSGGPSDWELEQVGVAWGVGMRRRRPTAQPQPTTAGRASRRRERTGLAGLELSGSGSGGPCTPQHGGLLFASARLRGAVLALPDIRPRAFNATFLLARAPGGWAVLPGRRHCHIPRCVGQQ